MWRALAVLSVLVVAGCGQAETPMPRPGDVIVAEREVALWEGLEAKREAMRRDVDGQSRFDHPEYARRKALDVRRLGTALRGTRLEVLSAGPGWLRVRAIGDDEGLTGSAGAYCEPPLFSWRAVAR